MSEVFWSSSIHEEYLRGDMGASHHVTNDDTGISNGEHINKPVSSTEDMMTALKKGSKKVQVKQVHCTSVCMVLSLVKYCVDTKVNLLSIMSLLSQGTDITKGKKAI